MLLDEAIFKHLSADTAITALCANRIHPVSLEQPAVYPAVVYTRLGTQRGHTHSGPDLCPEASMEFACFASTAKQAKTLADLVRVRLDGFKGLMGGTGGVNVHGAFAANDGYEFDHRSDVERGVFLCVLDVDFQYEE